ncbi:MAG: hypothetical protein B7Y36_18165 [Novosphingobium sp. 28-62-57]|nr:MULTISPECIES: DUF190 domain-containing protein [unclassified Novosphingobium]MBX9664863.1 DUF190 domain-containing protein [Novosphingobium sp.]OYZ08055.1 MAG: hypothetical protein B7Y36_18165 [Novosphingobium sp. 28-62-57]OZA40509.1 MAG: hypothetical protein B7X92_01315 [Novosphingobium sp. 17-62-9]HQS95416.1 DUF190 domain-containing protein [Novosphingobium sp.]
MGEPARKLLRIYIDEPAYVGDRKVFEYVASMAQDRKMAEFTVLEALIGRGTNEALADWDRQPVHCVGVIGLFRTASQGGTYRTGDPRER